MRPVCDFSPQDGPSSITVPPPHCLGGCFSLESVATRCIHPPLPICYSTLGLLPRYPIGISTHLLSRWQETASEEYFFEIVVLWRTTRLKKFPEQSCLEQRLFWVYFLPLTQLSQHPTLLPSTFLNFLDFLLVALRGSILGRRSWSASH